MRFIYEQNSDSGVLAGHGVSACFLKLTSSELDRKMLADKWHCHRDFEIHILTKGAQCYVTENSRFEVSEGNCFIIPPGISHLSQLSDVLSEKITLYFKYDYKTNPLLFSEYKNCYLTEISKCIKNDLEFIDEEYTVSKALSGTLIECRILNIIVNLIRAMGNKETVIHASGTQVPAILLLAERYIENNIETAPNVTDVARHCNISTRQLLRMFLKHEGISTFDYIKIKRLEAIQTLLADKSISLKTISKRMNFSSEYYLNVFFKKMYGMPPGTYRKMLSGTN